MTSKCTVDSSLWSDTLTTVTSDLPWYLVLSSLTQAKTCQLNSNVCWQIILTALTTSQGIQKATAVVNVVMASVLEQLWVSVYTRLIEHLIMPDWLRYMVFIAPFCNFPTISYYIHQTIMGTEMPEKNK